MIVTSKSVRKVRKTQNLGQDRLITLLEKQGREIHDHDKIIDRIEEFYTEQFNSELSTIFHIDPKDTPAIISWEVEASLRDMKNGTTTGNDHISIEPLAKLPTKCLLERRITIAWKNSKMVIISKKGSKIYIKNY